MKWVPLPHHAKALRFLLERPAAGLLLDPGMGKTSVTLAALKLLKLRALVIAPLRVCYEVWPAEAEKWDTGLRVAVLHGPKREQALESDADVYCINPEGLLWLGQWWHQLDGRPEALVIDESTKFKNPQTQRFKLLKPMLPTFGRRIILTGTPTPNGLLDLFGQIYVLDLGHSLGRFITHYRNAHFSQQPGLRFGKWELIRGQEEVIYQKIKPFALRLDAADYLRLPPKMDSTLTAELPPDAARAYAKLENDFVLRLRKGDVTPANAAVASGKLRQITGGHVYNDDGLAERIHTAKLEMLQELIDELSGQPALVAYQFNHEMESIRHMLGGDVPVISGASPRQLRTMLAEWNAGDHPVMLLHPDSAGHGLNLQGGGRHLIWYSLPWNAEHYDQTMGRIYRQGQTKPVVQYHLIMKGTVDEIVMRALRGKRKVQSEFLKAMRGRGSNVRHRDGERKGLQ